MAMSAEERNRRARERYHANREVNLAKQREYNALHIEKRRAQRNKWAKENPDKIKAQRKRRRERYGEEINRKHREYMNQKPEGSDLTYGQLHKRAYYRKHREELLAKQSLYQKSNREKINAYWRERYKKDPEPIKRRNQRYVTKHHEKVKARYRKHYHANRQRYLDYSLEWKHTHPDRARASARRSYWKHREKRIAASIVQHRRDKDKINQKAKEWRARSPKLRQWIERNRERRITQRKQRWIRYRDTFREFQNSYGIRTPRRLAIYRKWDACGELCYICGLHLAIDDIHVDHVIPVAKKGTNDIVNLMPAHKLCNIRKGDKLNFPLSRPDLIDAAKHIQAIPRNMTAQVRPEWESRRMRLKLGTRN